MGINEEAGVTSPASSLGILAGLSKTYDPIHAGLGHLEGRPLAPTKSSLLCFGHRLRPYVRDLFPHGVGPVADNDVIQHLDFEELASTDEVSGSSDVSS